MSLNASNITSLVVLNSTISTKLTSHNSTTSNMTVHCRALNHTMVGHSHSSIGSLTARNLAARSPPSASNGEMSPGIIFLLIGGILVGIFAMLMFVNGANNSHKKAYARARGRGRQGGFVRRGTMRHNGGARKGYADFGASMGQQATPGMAAPAPVVFRQGHMSGHGGRAHSGGSRGRSGGPKFPGPRNGFGSMQAAHSAARGRSGRPYRAGDPNNYV